MSSQPTTDMIRFIQRRWLRNYLLAWLLYALAASVIISSITHWLFNTPWWLVAPLFALLSLLVYLIRPFRKISRHDVSSFLNYQYPELEESSQLLLEPAGSLGFLQQLQRNKLEKVILTIPVPAASRKPLQRAMPLLFISVAVAFLCWVLTASPGTGSDLKLLPQATGGNKAKTVLPAGVREFLVEVTPPAYTGLKKRGLAESMLKVEEGSSVKWQITTTRQASSVQMIFNNDERVALEPSGKDSIHWTMQRTVNKPGFYQLELEGKTSPLYTLEIIPDLPVSIHILSPRQYTTLEAGQKPVAHLKVQLLDDYGIKDARIIATRASGKGESVSFKEQQLSFNTPIGGQREIQLSRPLDLASMGLQGGDELYFYIRAMDSRGQESRSDMYFISLPDTSELLSMSGMEAGVSQFPEYFRSQRQIIMDTEKLLKEQSSISKDTFNSRSNQLGIDQKLLRLRYGKFLGEESEDGGHSAGDGHDHGGEEMEYGDIQSIIDQYSHNHDNAEDASFFEPAQKAQLKNILTEMWNSELKLRVYSPAEALPFEYKALRLLKDLQQKSRAYVSKTSMKMPPLKPEKRLTGELDKIDPYAGAPREKEDENTRTALRKALALLEQLKYKEPLKPEDHHLLLSAEKSISGKAIEQPAIFLTALGAIRRIEQFPDKADRQDILQAQSALQRLLKNDSPIPQRKSSRTGNIAEYYFKNLNEKSR